MDSIYPRYPLPAEKRIGFSRHHSRPLQERSPYFHDHFTPDAGLAIQQSHRIIPLFPFCQIKNGPFVRLLRTGDRTAVFFLPIPQADVTSSCFQKRAYSRSRSARFAWNPFSNPQNEGIIAWISDDCKIFLFFPP